MLVCSKCGTPVRVAGHACPHCGHRGAVLRRVYAGERHEAPETAETAAPEAPEQARSVLAEATASGGLPDAQRAWSPWLAAVVGALFGPAAAVLVAARNLARFRPDGPDPWLVTALTAVLQMLLGLLVGWVARDHLAPAVWLGIGAGLVVLALVVRWQWQPVAEQRRSHLGRHTPGADAFGAFLLAALLGLGLCFGTLRVANRVSHGALQQALDQLKPPPAPPEMPMMQGMPPM